MIASVSCALILTKAVSQPRRTDWWNKEARSDYVMRSNLEAITPTGFLDDFGAFPLTAASKSPILASFIKRGGYGAIIKPDEKRAEGLLSDMEKVRGAKGWDMACEVLRVQLLVETKRDLMAIVGREIKTDLFKAKPECAFGTLLLSKSASRRKSKSPFIHLNKANPFLEKWRDWTADSDEGMEQHSLVCYATVDFGMPRIPILGALLRTKNLGAIEWGMDKMWGDLSKATVDPGTKWSISHLPPALRPPQAMELLRTAMRISDQNPKRRSPALTAFLTSELVGMERDCLVYGERYLAVAPPDHGWRTTVEQMIKKVKGKGP